MQFKLAIALLSVPRGSGPIEGLTLVNSFVGACEEALQAHSADKSIAPDPQRGGCTAPHPR